MAKASVFVVATERDASTKRHINDLMNKTTTQLIPDFQRLSIFMGENTIAGLIFVDKSLSIHLPEHICPSTVFPQLTYALSSGLPLSVLEMSRLMGVEESSRLLNTLILSFNHRNGFYKPLEMIFRMSEAGDGNMKDQIERTVGDQTWGPHMSKIAESLHLQPEQIIMHMVSDDSDLVLLPFMKIADSLGELFDAETGIYRGKYRFVYDIARGKQTVSERRSKAMKKLSEGSVKRLGVFEENLLSCVNTNDIYNLIPMLMDALVREFSAGSSDDIISAMKILMSEILIDIVTPIISSLKPFDADMKRWKDLVRWFKSVIGVEKLPINFSKWPRESLNVITTTMMAMQEDFTDIAVDIAAEYVNFFKDNTRRTPQWMNLLGPVIFATGVAIGDEEGMTLILTRGFIYVINVKMTGDEKHVIFPDTFKCEKGRIVFALPVTRWEFTPLPDENKSVGILSNEKNLFVMQFADTTGASKAAFWLCYNIVKNDIHNENMSVLVNGEKALVQLTYSATMNDFNMHATVSVIGETWDTTVPRSAVLMTALELKQHRGVDIIANEEKQIVPNRYVSYADVAFRQYSLESTIIHKAIELSKLERSSPTNTNEQDLVHCIFTDMVYSFNPYATFTALYHIKLSDFVFAVKRNSMELLELQLEAFPISLSEFSVNGLPLLHYACLTTDNTACIHVICKRCHVHLQSPIDGRTALFYALDNNNLLIAQNLINRKIDINACGNDRVSPLIYCLQKGKFDIAEYLLKNGASVHRMNLGSPCYSSALLYAITCHSIEMVNLLLPYSNNEINNPLTDGSFITHICIRENFTEVLELLHRVPSYDPNMYTDAYPHPLLYLVRNGKKPSMTELNHILSISTIDVNATDSKGNTLLVTAMKNGWTDIVLRLCEDERSDVDLCDDEGRTLVYLAVNSNNRVILEALIKADATVNMPNSDGMSPIYRAVEMDSIDLTKMLLDAGATANAWYVHGKLPVHIAISEQIKELLLSHNATPDAPIFGL